MADSIETPLLRVPYESLRRTTRDRKYALEAIEAQLDHLQAECRTERTVEEHAAFLDSIIKEISTWQESLGHVAVVEAADIWRCGKRLRHLVKQGPPPRDGALAWNRPRLDRILVDHMLRSGYHESAALLTSEKKLEDLVDSATFKAAREVLDALACHDCRPALAWCMLYGPRLKKNRSCLEFQLRVQEFVELVRAVDLMGAITYARRHLAQWAEIYEEDHQRACALLAFSGDTKCERYTDLLVPERWEYLVELFYAELFKLQSLPSVSLLSVHLQAGLSALKTPQSLEGAGAREDPLHLPTFRKLAEAVPYSKHVHSKLVCAITREPMNEHNHPMVTPAGAIYSEQGISEVTARNGGVFVCPHTGERYEVSALRRVYIS